MLPLLVPADRPERFQQSIDSGADALVIDLEDTVADDSKIDARARLAGHLARLRPSNTALLIRTNARGTPWFGEDLIAVVQIEGLEGILLPKAEAAVDIERIRKVVGDSVVIVALIETAKGLRAAEDIAKAADRLAFGAIGFALDLLMSHTQEGLLQARSSLVLASRLAGLPPPIDGATLDRREDFHTEGDVRYAASLGFSGALLIHPDQIAPARRGFVPTNSELQWAATVIERSQAEVTLPADAPIIDQSVLRQAERILRRFAAGRTF